MNINFESKSLNKIVEQLNTVIDRVDFFSIEEAIQNHDMTLSTVYTHEYLNEAPAEAEALETSEVWDFFSDCIIAGGVYDEVVIIDRDKFLCLCVDAANYKIEQEKKEQEDYYACINVFHQELKELVSEYENMSVSTSDYHHFYISDLDNVSLNVRIKDHSFSSGAGKAYGFSRPDVEFVYENKEQFSKDVWVTLSDIEMLIEDNL